MRGMITVIRPLAAIAAVAFAAGCFPTPNLTVTPGAISIGADDDGATLRLLNTGGGTLAWTVSESLPWLSLDEVDKQAATVSGTIATGVAVIDLVLDRSALPIGQTNGEIQITSNGGNIVVPVSVSQAGPAVLAVSQTQLDFGATSTQSNLLISNSGLEPLTWQLTVPANAPWLRATPASGTIQSSGVTETVSVTVDRSQLAAGDFTSTIAITSNGGNQNVGVGMSVIPFGVTPEAITFGTLNAPDSESLTIANSAPNPLTLAYAVTTDSGGAWLTLDQNSATVPANTQANLSVQANPAGLAPGSYTGTVTISNTVAGFSIDIPVSMSVTAIEVSTNLIDFGTITTTQTRTFTVSNLGGAAQNYNVNVPPLDAFWLSVSPNSGTATGAPATHTVTVDPSDLEPGAYASTLTVNFGAGTETIEIRAARPRPARLVVVSSNVIFGGTLNRESIDIWNDGIGSVNWSVSTAGFPAWLSIEEAAGPNIGGTVSGDTTDTITLLVDRSLAPPDVFDFSFSFDVTATGDFTGTVPVTVSMTVPRIAEIEVIADGTDSTGVPFLNFDIGINSKTFIIRNTGNGTLNWNFTGQQLPPWISSIQPIQAGLEPGTEQQVTITVSRNGLTFVGAQAVLQLFNNDPTSPGGFLPLSVEVQVPKTIAIGVRPDAVAFGEDASIGIGEVANVGDPGTTLNYQITSNKEWLAVFPETGQSIGTEASIKDFQPHTITVDRSRLEGSGAAAKLTVVAFEVVGGVRVPLEGVAPVEISVTVEAAKLTFENGPPRVRVPSMVRFVLLMRNLQYAPIKLPAARLATLAQQIQIFENDRQSENSETAQIIKPTVPKGNALILLDYSNSMQQSARAVADATVSGAADPVQALYERCIAPLLAEIPPNYNVGIALFSERTGSTPFTDALRPVYGTATESPETEDEVFLSDRALLQARLADIVVGTNGATELLPALQDAGQLIADEDRIAGIFPFDDADDRLIICVSDGRLTTPPGSITSTSQFLSEILGTRVWSLGWGSEVASAPLVQLAVETGGHHYATRTQPTGAVDAFGTPIRIPLVDELLDWCTTTGDECDLSIANDIDAQFIFNYVSLTEEVAEIEGRVTFDDPTDQDSICLSEQGEVSGTFFGAQVPLPSVSTDPNLAQIRLKTLGLRPDGSATIEVYLDYAARDLRSFSFQMSTTGAAPLLRANVAQVARTQGGLISTWLPSGAGTTFTYTAPVGEPPLTYGDFGPLLTIEVSGVADPDARLLFEVLSPQFVGGNPDVRYVTHPDSIRLATDEFLATSLPRPDIELVAVNDVPVVNESDFLFFDELDRLVFDMGTTVNCFTLRFHNWGGSHDPTSVLLRYFPTINASGIVEATQDLPGCDLRVPDIAEWEDIRVSSTLEPVDRKFVVLRNVAPGILDGRASVIDDIDFELEFDFLITGVGYDGTIDPIYLRMEVLPAVLEVAPAAVNFGAVQTVASVTVSNSGQSIMFWEIANIDAFPAWLQVDEISGLVEDNETNTVNFGVNRALAPPGATTTFNVQFRHGQGASVQTVTVPVTVTVP